jgi:hypothetical protein
MSKPSDAEKVALSKEQVPRDEKPTQRIPKELIDRLFSVAGCPQGLTGPEGLLKQLTSARVDIGGRVGPPLHALLPGWTETRMDSLSSAVPFART